MKLNVKLNVSAKDFYDVIVNSVAEDIKVHTGKETKPYVGFEFNKSLKRTNKSFVDTTFKITALDENECYSYDVITPVEITTVTYLITPIDENSIDLFYEECPKAESKRVGANHKLMGGFFGFFFGNRKMKKKLYAIESYIINSK